MLFCWNCGVKLPVQQPAAPSAPATPATPAPAPEAVPAAPVTTEPSAAPAPSADERTPVSKESGAYVNEGAIFTNLRALAGKLGTDTDTLGKLLMAYAEAALAAGIRYHLIDVSDYHFLNPEAAKNRRLSLSPSDSWVDHTHVLADYFRFGRSTSEDVTNYLFIIGGGDVIPMPVVPHYIDDPDSSDSDIDTDIPYAYILGEKTYHKFGTAELFQYEQYFHVGRLPLAANASLDDLVGYLRCAAKSFDAVNIKRSFGLTDLTWLSASVWVSDPFRRHKLYRGDERLSEQFFTRNLYISPCVTSSLVDKVFDRTADMFYFNLHGSDAPTMCSFYASYNDDLYEAITPRQLAAAEKPNMVVTEACYGAKFQDYNRGETMLLAAMANKTLVYLGSSRIAWGVSQCDSQAKLNNADRIANVYMARLLEGHTAGEALFLARQSFFEMNEEYFTPHQALTIVEFNLFGDPFLYAGQRRGEAKVQLREVKALAKGPVNAVVERKCIYQAKPASLLDEVRNAVDHNLMMIRSTVDKQLYERLGVEPRKLSTVSRMKYGNGDEFYAFNYVETDGTIESRHTATADLSGKVITIISTK
ncbi:C25 family cysteine peptidase [uncultured Alistipes sp.]|uniref:C25 family cysteine peptidase n=1 Tax=uncultured Alistipes sp. TaxID=538949 RepID=UPI0025D99F42|nr:C25 family cysteine peptidase [uncultured Alistipes sp.]